MTRCPTSSWQLLIKYMQFYKWVALIDVDYLPLNYSRSLAGECGTAGLVQPVQTCRALQSRHFHKYPFADILDDSYDVMVVDRDNGEVQSSYFVQSTAEGRAIKEWYRTCHPATVRHRVCTDVTATCNVTATSLQVAGL